MGLQRSLTQLQSIGPTDPFLLVSKKDAEIWMGS